MDVDSKDLNNAFKRFKERVEFMFKGPLAAKGEEIQRNYFMIWVGEKGCQIYSTRTFTADEQKNEDLL